MTSSLDELFEYLDRWGEPIQEIDRISNTVYLKARNGRLVSLQLTAANASQLASRTDLEWMGGPTPVERSFGLFMVHVDETINSFANHEQIRFMVNDDGSPAPVE
jgi:hypothetical protein